MPHTVPHKLIMKLVGRHCFHIDFMLLFAQIQRFCVAVNEELNVRYCRVCLETRGVYSCDRLHSADEIKFIFWYSWFDGPTSIYRNQTGLKTVLSHVYDNEISPHSGNTVAWWVEAGGFMARRNNMLFTKIAHAQITYRRTFSVVAIDSLWNLLRHSLNLFCS